MIAQQHPQHYVQLRRDNHFLTSLIPTAVGNATKVFDVDSALTDTSISGAYIDEIWFTYSKRSIQKLDAVTPTQGHLFSNMVQLYSNFIRWT